MLPSSQAMSDEDGSGMSSSHPFTSTGAAATYTNHPLLRETHASDKSEEDRNSNDIYDDQFLISLFALPPSAENPHHGALQLRLNRVKVFELALAACQAILNIMVISYNFSTRPVRDQYLPFNLLHLIVVYVEFFLAMLYILSILTCLFDFYLVTKFCKLSLLQSFLPQPYSSSAVAGGGGVGGGGGVLQHGSPAIEGMDGVSNENEGRGSVSGDRIRQPSDDLSLNLHSSSSSSSSSFPSTASSSSPSPSTSLISDERFNGGVQKLHIGALVDRTIVFSNFLTSFSILSFLPAFPRLLTAARRLHYHATIKPLERGLTLREQLVAEEHHNKLSRCLFGCGMAILIALIMVGATVGMMMKVSQVSYLFTTPFEHWSSIQVILFLGFVNQLMGIVTERRHDVNSILQFLHAAPAFPLSAVSPSEGRRGGEGKSQYIVGPAQHRAIRRLLLRVYTLTVLCNPDVPQHSMPPQRGIPWYGLAVARTFDASDLAAAFHRRSKSD